MYQFTHTYTYKNSTPKQNLITLGNIQICTPFLVKAKDTGKLSVIIAPYADSEVEVIFFDLSDSRIRYASLAYLMRNFVYADKPATPFEIKFSV